MSNPLGSVRWIHGAPVCAQSSDPLLQVYQFDDDTFILRQSKCFNYEGNFFYLLFGQQRVVLFDTGAAPSPDFLQRHPDPKDRELPIREEVQKIIAQWLAGRGGGSVDLVVAHTHSHGDHVHGDSQFIGQPNTTLVWPQLSAVKSFFGLPNWPNGEARFELGGRQLTVLPLPGHEQTHIAVYDPRTEALLTGDTLYPGLLTVQDWSAYRRSVARLSEFATQHPVSLVLGNHIEMKNSPRELYPIGTTYQPDEHPLSLKASHMRRAASRLRGDG